MSMTKNTNPYKECTRCHTLKPNTAEFFYFYKSIWGEYLQSACKECNKKDAVRRKKLDPQKAKEIQKRSVLKKVEHYREIAYKYAHTEKGRESRRLSRVRARSRNPERYNARELLKRAVRSAKIIRGVCEVCSNPKTDGHHTDYSLPYDVRWLCRLHHQEVHKQQKM